MNKMAQLSVEKMLAETGHVLTVADFDDLAALHRAAQAVTNPDDEDESSLWAAPHQVGNILLYPLTLGVAVWMSEQASEWFGDKDPLADLAVAWALSLGQLPGELWEVRTARECKRRVRAWARKLTATPQQLGAALEKMLPSADPGADDGEKGGGYGPTISLLIREYGKSPEYWMWKTSVKVIHVLLKDYADRINEQIEAENRAARKAGGKAAQGLPLPRKAERVRYAKLIKALQIKWSETNGG